MIYRANISELEAKVGESYLNRIKSQKYPAHEWCDGRCYAVENYRQALWLVKYKEARWLKDAVIYALYKRNDPDCAYLAEGCLELN